MALFEFLEKSTNRWLWFFGIFIGSFIPVGLRLFIGHDYKTTEFDIKDLLFAALAMNLSNLSLVTGKKFETKILIVLVSTLFIVLIAYGLGAFLTDEAAKTKPTGSWLFNSSIVFSILSILVSFEANNYTIKNVKHE